MAAAARRASERKGEVRAAALDDFVTRCIVAEKGAAAKAAARTCAGERFEALRSRIAAKELAATSSALPTRPTGLGTVPRATEAGS